MEDRTIGFSVPWNLVTPAVIAALAGLVFYFKPLSTDRPPIDAGRAEAIGYADVDARLWQDPFKAVADKITEQDLATNSRREQFVSSFKERLRSVNFSGEEEPKSTVLVMPVMISASAYADFAEQRLRTRVAVLNGLARCGYNPEDTTHIGFFCEKWDKRALDGPNGSDASEAKDLSVVIPYEWMRQTSMPMPIYGGKRGYAQKYSRVLVLWLNEDLLTDRPIYRLGKFLTDMLEGVAAGIPPSGPSTRPATCPTAAASQPTTAATSVSSIKVCVIGPRASTTLRAMAWDVKRVPRASMPCDLEFVCPTATAEERAILDDRSMEWSLANQEIDAKYLSGYLSKSIDGHTLSLTRTAPNDYVVCKALTEELQNRGLNLHPTWLVNAGGTLEANYVDADHVAIIAEWDTFFGRALPLSFGSICCGRTVNELAASKIAYPANIHPFVYLRGIDGRATTDAAAERARIKAAGAAKEPIGGMRRPNDPPEDTNQSDYIRRLAQQLADLDCKLRLSGERLKAVGVLGTDVYDKLMILNALRAELPGIIFFTTDLDARYEMPTEWPATHNLLIASGYGQRLHQSLQGGIASFRDASQTATFAATLTALGLIDRRQFDRSKNDTEQAFVAPRLFEISRSGAFDLSVDGPAQANQRESTGKPDAATPLVTIHPPREDLNNFLNRGAWRISCLIVCAVCVTVALGVWYWFVTEDGQTSRLGDLIYNAARESYVFVPCLTLLVISLVWVFHGQDGSASEPLSFVNGISAWPTQIARVTAVLLVIYFVVRSEIDRRTNNAEIETLFGLKKSDPANPDKRIAGKLISGDADAVWADYRVRSEPRRRIAVAFGFAALYAAASTSLLLGLGRPYSPIRGDFARNFDFTITMLVIAATAFYTVFTLHGSYVNRRFIRALVQRRTIYPDGAFGRVLEDRIDNTHTTDELPRRKDIALLYTEWMDIQLIAMRTKIVGRSVYQAMVIFGLLSISRTSLFDDWDWPAGLVAIFVVSGFLVILAAILLRTAAESAREDALKTLDRRRLHGIAQKKDDHVKLIEQITESVKSEKGGAFATLSQYPWLTALLIPSGGIGLWALLEQLPKLFQ